MTFCSLRGVFGRPPASASSLEAEGFGRVAAVGPGVANVKVGGHVLAPIFGFDLEGAPARSGPEGSSRYLTVIGCSDAREASCSSHPTAALILSEYVDLSSPAIELFNLEEAPASAGL